VSVTVADRPAWARERNCVGDATGTIAAQCP